MKKIAAVLSIMFLLCSCGDSKEVKLVKWKAFCTSHDFTEKQCEVLYVLKEGSDEASDNANFAAAMAGVSMGMAAGAGGRR